MSRAIYTASWTPFCVLLVLGFTLAAHFSRHGMSNRHAAFQGLLLCLALTGATSAGLALNVDTDDVLADVGWCWVEHTDMGVLVAERAVRYGVQAAMGVIVGAEAVW